MQRLPSIQTLEADIRNYEEQLKKAKLELEKAKSAHILRPYIPLATALHDQFCGFNHTDGCSWEYESWEQLGHARSRHIDKARSVDSILKEVIDGDDIEAYKQRAEWFKKLLSSI